MRERIFTSVLTDRQKASLDINVMSSIRVNGSCNIVVNKNIESLTFGAMPGAPLTYESSLMSWGRSKGLDVNIITSRLGLRVLVFKKV